jgi:hypothetical protein
VAQKFLDAEDVTGLMIKHGCLPMPQRIEVYLENPQVLCLYYSADYCRLFSDAKMLNGAETTFALSQNGAETCLTVTIR